MILRILAIALFAAMVIAGAMAPAAAWTHRDWTETYAPTSYDRHGQPNFHDAAFIGSRIHFGYRGMAYDGLATAYAYGDPVWKTGCRRGYEPVATDLGPELARVRVCP